jgi:hypothetical protein
MAERGSKLLSVDSHTALPSLIGKNSTKDAMTHRKIKTE